MGCSGIYFFGGFLVVIGLGDVSGDLRGLFLAAKGFKNCQNSGLNILREFGKENGSGDLGAERKNDN